MLVLTRRTQERLILRVKATRTVNGVIVETQEVIEIRMLGVRGNQMRIGITAPDGVEVNRAEVDERKYGVAK